MQKSINIAYLSRYSSLLLLFLAAISLVSASTSSSPYTEFDTSWYGSTPHPTSAFRSVTDFGAKGDGVTDDTRAIQLAIDHSRGSINAKAFAVVYFPPGVYLVSDTLVVYSGTELRGNSVTPPTIRLAPSTPKFMNTSSKQPLIATTSGYDQTTNYSSTHWWDNSIASNCIFYVHIHKLNIDLTNGNIGATALYWCVAQQTSLRDMELFIGDAAHGIDICVSEGYEHQGGGGNGGGGTIEDISIYGGESAIRADSSQWTFRGLTLKGQRYSAIVLQDMIWSFAFVDVNVSDTPAVMTSISGLDETSSTVCFIDVIITNVTGAIVFNMTGAGHPIFFQNVQFIGPYPSIIVANNSGMYYPWPVTPVQGLIERWAGWPAPNYSQNGIIISSNNYWQAYMDLPNSPNRRLYSQPRPYFDDLTVAPCNAITDCGATGTNVTDDTAALQSCVDKCEAVFLPGGIYRIKDTLTLKSTSMLIGEIYTNIYLDANAPGFNDATIEKAVIDTPDSSSSTVKLTDISVIAGIGNPGATLIRWRSGPSSGMWDVNLNISAGASILYGIHVVGAGSGILANVWAWGADHSYWSMDGLTLDHAMIGFLGESAGPLTAYGLACEHHLQAMLALRGAANYDLITFQSEEANPIVGAEDTVHIELTGGCENVTIYGALSCNWWNPSVNHLAIASNVSSNVNIIGLRSRGSPNAPVLQPEPAGYGPSRLQTSGGWWAILFDGSIPSGNASQSSF